MALMYLKKALKLELKTKNLDAINLAGTMLNICAIFSQLKKHKKAIKYASSAVAQIEEALGQF